MGVYRMERKVQVRMYFYESLLRSKEEQTEAVLLTRR